MSFVFSCLVLVNIWGVTDFDHELLTAVHASSRTQVGWVDGDDFDFFGYGMAQVDLGGAPLYRKRLNIDKAVIKIVLRLNPLQSYFFRNLNQNKFAAS